MATIEEYYTVELKCDRCRRIYAYGHDPISEEVICAACCVYHGKEEIKK